MPRSPVRRLTWSIFGPLLLVASVALSDAAPPEAEGRTATRELARLIDAQWVAEIAANPLAATAAGDNRYNDRLPLATAAEFARRAREDADFLARLRRIDRAALPAADRLNLDLLDFVLRHRVALAPFRDYRIPLVSDEGFHVEVTRMADGVPMHSIRDYKDYLARLAAIRAYFEQNIANMRTGLADGFTLPAEILKGVQTVIDAEQFGSAEASPFYEPFRHLPDTIPPAERARLAAAGRATIETAVLPAYRELKRFFVAEYVPGARHSVGARELPDGERYYAAFATGTRFGLGRWNCPRWYPRQTSSNCRRDQPWTRPWPFVSRGKTGASSAKA